MSGRSGISQSTRNKTQGHNAYGKASRQMIDHDSALHMDLLGYLRSTPVLHPKAIQTASILHGQATPFKRDFFSSGMS